MLATNFFDETTDTIIRAVRLAANLFVATQNRFARTHINNNVAVLFTLNKRVDDCTGFVFEIFVLLVTLSFADLLQDHLLGGLCCNTAQLHWWDDFNKLLADLRVSQIFAGLLNSELGLIIFHQLFFNNRTNAGEGRFAGAAVDGNTNVHLRAIPGLRRTRERFFHRLNNQIGVDVLFTGHGLGSLQKLKLVC